MLTKCSLVKVAISSVTLNYPPISSNKEAHFFGRYVLAIERIHPVFSANSSKENF